MANRVDATLGVKVSYVVANPSSYAWPDASRPLPVADAEPAAAAKGWMSETPHHDFRYGPFQDPQAKDYDLWPYGLENRKDGYGGDQRCAAEGAADLASGDLSS